MAQKTFEVAHPGRFRASAAQIEKAFSDALGDIEAKAEAVFRLKSNTAGSKSTYVANYEPADPGKHAADGPAAEEPKAG